MRSSGTTPSRLNLAFIHTDTAFGTFSALRCSEFSVPTAAINARFDAQCTILATNKRVVLALPLRRYIPTRVTTR